jgi:hypothetical protein
MIRRAPLLGLIALLVAAPAGAVGLGPLIMSGFTAGERKGFFLTLINPAPVATRFRLYPVGWDNELPFTRARLSVGESVLGPGAQRKLLVVADGLVPGESLRFRVCAERANPDEKELVHGRVCAKLVARRLG